MTTAQTTRCLLAAVGTLLFACPAVGQERQERNRFLDPSTEVTDDPRRIPVPPGLKGPDGVIVADQTPRTVEPPRYLIESNTTNLRDVGSAGEVPFRLRDRGWQRSMLAPRIYPGCHFGAMSRRFIISKEDNFDVLRRMREAGIKMGNGTDLSSDWF